MKRPATTPALFSVAVIRGLLRYVIKALGTAKGDVVARWNAVTFSRFVLWVAALEGAVDVVPEALEVFDLAVKTGYGDTCADYHPPLEALQKIALANPDAELHAELLRHRSSRVRYMLAEVAEFRSALQNDVEPSVRTRARCRYFEQPMDPPWWTGVLSRPPSDSSELLKFGELTKKLDEWSDWSGSEELAGAFRALPRDLADEIAPRFVSTMWCPSTWTEAVWEVLVQSSRPLAERVTRIEAAVEVLVAAGPCVETAHGAAIERAVQGCPAHEQGALLSLVERVRSQLERPDTEDRNAFWPTAARRSLQARTASAEAARSAACPRSIFERLVGELASPGPWGTSRFAQHPRARFELARGLAVLMGRAPRVLDARATARNLADIVATCIERRPTATEAMIQALAGLLRTVDLDDPLLARVARHPSPAVREALALSAADGSPRHAEALLAAPEPEVWTAARMVMPAAEPWRGVLPSDPFEGCLPDDAAALVPVLLDLDAALPRVRHATLTEDDFARVARVATRLPGPLACVFARRFLPDRRLTMALGPVAAALLMAEGGWQAWLQEVERRIALEKNFGVWFGGHLVTHAVKAAESPSDGGPAFPWPNERRRDAARDALARYEREKNTADIGDMWIVAALSLWPDEDDPLPMPGPWRGVRPPYSVSAWLATLDFRAEWGATQALLNAARGGFAEEWHSWHGTDKLLDRLPAALKLDAAHEGFWQERGFGDWSRSVLTAAIAEARAAGGDALAVLLGDARLAPEHLIDAARTTETLFVLRARLAAGLADLAEALLTLTLVAVTPKVAAATDDELAGWRARWSDAIQAVMSTGAGGLRASFVTLAPPGLWEPLDRSFVHAVASDATLEEAQAIARRLAQCGDADDLDVARELAERYPEAAAWTRLARTLADRGAGGQR